MLLGTKCVLEQDDLQVFYHIMHCIIYTIFYFSISCTVLYDVLFILMTLLSLHRLPVVNKYLSSYLSIIYFNNCNKLNTVI